MHSLFEFLKPSDIPSSIDKVKRTSSVATTNSEEVEAGDFLPEEDRAESCNPPYHREGNEVVLQEAMSNHCSSAEEILILMEADDQETNHKVILPEGKSADTCPEILTGEAEDHGYVPKPLNLDSTPQPLNLDSTILLDLPELFVHDPSYVDTPGSNSNS